jgi:hypothetical protein
MKIAATFGPHSLREAIDQLVADEVAKETARCLAKCEGERLSDNVKQPDDRAYEFAIDCCVKAISAKEGK